MSLRKAFAEVAGSTLAIVRTRLELFALEAAAQKSQLLHLFLLLAGVLLFGVLGVLVLSIALALYFWSTPYRYAALFGLAFLYLLVALILFVVIRLRLRRGSMPFAATLDELRRDIDLLERLREPSSPRQGDER